MARLDATIGIVLAAGLSRRFGSANKLLAPLRGRPLAAHIAQTIAELPLAQRIAVCPAGDTQVAEIFAGAGLSVVINAESARGQASSLALGVTHAAPYEPQALLVCLADMPFVTGQHLRAVIKTLDAKSSIVASASTITAPPLPPAAFLPQHFAALRVQHGDQGARDLLRQARKLAVSAEQLMDFDTEDDFNALPPA